MSVAGRAVSGPVGGSAPATVGVDTTPDPTIASAERPPWGYRPGLDGLRAVAVIAVVLYHNGFRSVPGGFLGVDVFFALSGFLITSLLLDEYDRHRRIGLIEFWARRFRRLLPALLLVVVAITIYLWNFENPLTLSLRRDDAPWVLTYLTNWHFIGAQQSYFEAFTAPNPFRHMWSLAVEEQWYLIWPPIVCAALWLRRGRSDLLLVVAAVLAVGSAVLMAVLIPTVGDPTRSYYGTDTRAQTLLVGAIAAIALRNRTLTPGVRRILAWAGAVGSVLMVACFLTVQDTSLRMYTGGFLLFGVLATVVVVDAAHPGSPLESVLSIRPLRWIGVISYGIYLWHWPIHLWINPTRFDVSFPLIVLLRGAVTVGAAWLSFHLVERPSRRWLEGSGGHPPRARRRSPWVTYVAAALSIALVMFGFDRATDRMVRDDLSAAAPAVAEPAAFPLPGPFGPSHHLRTTILGDSTGVALAVPGLLRDVEVTNRAILGCGATTGEYYFGDFPRRLAHNCGFVARGWVEAAAKPTDLILVFLGGWEVFDPRVDGHRLPVGSADWRRWFTGELTRRVERMQAAAPDPVPIAFVHLPCPATDSMRLSLGAWERTDPKRVAAVNDALDEIVRQSDGLVRAVGYEDLVCTADGRYRDRDATGERPRPDGLHVDGAARVRVWQSLIDQVAPDLVAAARSGRSG